MATIQLRHIGPIADSGSIHLTQVMLFIGRQSSGKSTFLKILCFCRWLEKQIMVSSENVVALYTHNMKFLKSLKQFYRFSDSYFAEDSEILYDGDVVRIELKGANNNARIHPKTGFGDNRYNTKLGFIPSERNLMSAVRNIDQAYRSSENDVLFNYIFEWNEAKDGYTASSPKHLSFMDGMEYVNDDGRDSVRLPDRKTVIPVFYASSGVQSAMPLDVMTDYLTGLVGKNARFSWHDITRSLSRHMEKNGHVTQEFLSDFNSRNRYESVQLFIEEPEQNLYPESQRKLILEIISALKRAGQNGEKESIAVMTTHSPYVLSVLNVLMIWTAAVEQRPDDERLLSLIGSEYLLPLSAYSAYYINEDGTFADIVDKEIPMISGNDLDGVSDWVDDSIAQINSIMYGED